MQKKQIMPNPSFALQCLSGIVTYCDSFGKQFQGPVVKKVPFRHGSQNSPFCWELSVSCNAKRIILQNGPAIETELFLQQAPGLCWHQISRNLVHFELDLRSLVPQKNPYIVNERRSKCDLFGPPSLSCCLLICLAECGNQCQGPVVKKAPFQSLVRFGE